MLFWGIFCKESGCLVKLIVINSFWGWYKFVIVVQLNCNIMFGGVRNLKFNRFVAILAAVSVMMSSYITAFAGAVEYTNGPRVKRVDINDYIYSADDAYTKNPYETNSFAEFSSKQKE